MSRRANITTSRKTLNRAYTELHHAKDDEGVRQAAEKGWRAAREAVYTVMAAGGEEARGTVGGGYVRDFEATCLPHELGLADGYETAQNTLHGQCFYDGNYGLKDRETIKRTLDRIKTLIADCEYALALLRNPKRRRR